MPRTLPEWIGATDNSPVPPRVKARVLIRYKRKCYLTGTKIRSGTPWDIEHVIALINGGENRESNLAPILRGKPHRDKTKADLAEKSKVARMRLKDLGIYPKPIREIPSRPFPTRADVAAWRERRAG